jgi:hypothetical protein
MSDRFELSRLRVAGLSPFDIKVFSTFMTTGGEFPFYVDRLKPATRDLNIAGMNLLITRDLIWVDPSRSNGHRWMLCLTDNGRAVCAQLEKMNANRPVVVEMDHDTPTVISQT